MSTTSNNYLGVIAALALLALSICFIGFGCDPNSVNQFSNNQIAGTQTVQAIDQNGQTVRIVMVSPSKSEEYGTSTHIKREVKIARIVSPFGVSAGEVIAKQEPMKLSTNKDGGIDATTGGFRWTLFDSIWMWIKNMFWFGILGGAILLILYFVFPAAKPIIGMIGRAISSVIPVVGSITERITAGLKWKKPAVEIIKSGQKFKEDIDKNVGDFTPEQKIKIKKIFNEAHEKGQDKDTQKFVKDVKNDI